MKPPPDGQSRISPYLLYEDVASAIDFLAGAFGLRERLRMSGPDGVVNHAEMELDGAVVMLGSPGADYRNPKHLGGVTQSLYVYVDDVDAHCAAARAGGAVIVAEPEDQFYGDRRYGAEDPEGHQWYFASAFEDD